jgi:hydrogenase/urease accessory protein HupE
MTNAAPKKAGFFRNLDGFGVVALLFFIAVAVWISYEAVEAGYFKTWWHFGAFLLVCVAGLAVGLPSPGVPAPKNAKVHGAAAPASEQDALAAARGKTKPSPLHDQQFSD